MKRKSPCARTASCKDAGPGEAELMALYERYKRFVFAKTGEYTLDPVSREAIALGTWTHLLRNAGWLAALEEKKRIVYIALSVQIAAMDDFGKRGQLHKLESECRETSGICATAPGPVER